MVGGYTDVDGSYFDSVDAIDLSSEPLTCDSVSDYPFPVGKMPSGAILEGLPTVCGGHSADSGSPTNKCHQYFFNENRWEPMDPGMSVERSFAGSSMVDSATWLISGGQNRFGIVQSSTEVWHDGMFQQGPELPYPLYQHCQVTLNSSYIAFLGGNNGTSGMPYFHLLDWKNQNWITMPDIPFKSPVMDPCALIENSDNGMELVVLARYDTCYIFNFKNMSWRPGPSIDYDISVIYREMTVQMEKNFYIMGGYLEDEDSVTDAIFEFDSENYMWRLDATRLPTAKRGGVAIAVPDQVIDCS